MTTPAMRAVRESLAGRKVTLLTSPSGAALHGMLPDVDEVMVYESPWMKSTSDRADSSADQAMIQQLRERRFDAAMIFTVFSQNPLPAALMCYLAEIPLRAAYCRENPYHLLTDWLPEQDSTTRSRHEVRRQLELAAALGCTASDERLRIQSPATASANVRELLQQLELEDSRQWLVLHAGATALSRRYPHFAAVTEQLVDQGVAVIFTGSQEESPLIDSIRERVQKRTTSLAGRLSLSELVALIERAPIVLTNNTGPAHLAAAVQTPVVDLYALTNPQHTPWQVPQRVLFHDVPCKFCFKSVCPEQHHDCLARVSPTTVVAAVLELLQETASDRCQWPATNLDSPVLA